MRTTLRVILLAVFFVPVVGFCAPNVVTSPGVKKSDSPTWTGNHIFQGNTTIGDAGTDTLAIAPSTWSIQTGTVDIGTTTDATGDSYLQFQSGGVVFNSDGKARDFIVKDDAGNSLLHIDGTNNRIALMNDGDTTTNFGRLDIRQSSNDASGGLLLRLNGNNGAWAIDQGGESDRRLHFEYATDGSLADATGDFTIYMQLTNDGTLIPTIFQLPSAANPTVNATGEMALDTTDGAIVAYDGAVAQVVAHATHTAVISISSGTGWDSLSIPVFTAPDNMAITINKILAETMPAGSTVTYQLNERAFGSLNSAGTDVFSVTESTAHAGGTTNVAANFSNASITANASLVFVTDATGSAGSPAMLKITIYYTKDRE